MVVGQYPLRIPTRGSVYPLVTGPVAGSRPPCRTRAAGADAVDRLTAIPKRYQYGIVPYRK